MGAGARAPWQGGASPPPGNRARRGAPAADDLAAAHEEAATLYDKTARPRLREHMLRSAYHRFQSLGMTLRTDRLARENPWLISRDLVPAGSGLDPGGAHQLFRALSAARTPESLANIVLGTVADTTGASRIIGLTGEEEQLTVRALYENGKTTTIDGPWTEVPYDREIVRRVVESRSPLIVATDPVGVGSALDRPSPHDATLQSTLAVPVRVQDKTIGIIYAEHHEPGKHFTAAQQEAVAFLARRPLLPLELPTRSTVTGRRRVPPITHRRPITIRTQRVAAHSRHRRPSSRPQRPPC